MQTRRHSLFEAGCNVLTGMVTAWVSTQYIAVPLLGMSITLGQNTILTVFLTVVSIARTYLWRRFFNKIRGNK